MKKKAYTRLPSYLSDRHDVNTHTEVQIADHLLTPHREQLQGYCPELVSLRLSIDLI